MASTVKFTAEKMKIKRIISCLLFVLLTLSFSLAFSFSATAEDNGAIVGQSNIINGGFEDPDLKTANPTVNWLSTTKDQVAGWETTSTDGKIEFGWMKDGASVETASAHMVPTVTTELIAGKGASDGFQFAEVVGAEPSSLYQSLSLNAGRSYEWTVHHRGREGVDTLALFLTDDMNISYVKPDNTGEDHFFQIVSWMKAQGVTAPSAGVMEEYAVYTTALKESVSFEESSTGSYFSHTEDAEHTVKFRVYLMSTGNSTWGEYTGTYQSDTKKNVLFALTPFSSASTKNPSNSGNLIDNLSFLDTRGNNLLINAGFDDVATTAAYRYFSAANASSPTAGIGWNTTASDGKVEVGNIQKGNAYGLDVTLETTVYNAPSIREGNQFVELNAAQESSLYQLVSTEAGKMYKWSLSHRGRAGLDTMALIIGPGQEYAPKKANGNSQARDQLMKIVDWLYAQTDVALDIPERGCSEKIKLYSPKFNSNGGYALSTNVFSWQKDAEHTEEWSVWIISSLNDGWHDYGELDAAATYDHEYIVPEGHNQSIFGFVSISSTKGGGVKDATYGNLLDNISFKEYYYLDIDNDINSGGAALSVSSDREDGFIAESGSSGWALADNSITIRLTPGAREIIGTYINDVYVPLESWTYDAETGEYTYTFENVNSAIKVNILYKANTIIYDSRSKYEYQYDGASGGCEFQINSSFVNYTYTSHAPTADDGWRFIGWEYRSTVDDKIYTLDAVHKVQFDEEAKLFNIYRILPDDTVELVVGGIPEIKGITFVAKWKYRQRVIASYFDTETSQYDVGTTGGTADINVQWGDPVDKADYVYNEEVVGKEIYVPSDNTYVNVSAYNKIGYAFNGWYDKDRNLLSRNVNYTYKVETGKVVEIYALFEPKGYDVFIDCSVVGKTADTAKYFTIHCTFSNLRAGVLYVIAELPTDRITVGDVQVTNPITLRADNDGNAETTIYMKHGDSARFVYLPEGCVYSVLSESYVSDGYTVRGEVSSQILSGNVNVNLVYYRIMQSVKIGTGKDYSGIGLDIDTEWINITKNSSYTVGVETEYSPQLYTGLSPALCFYDEEGVEANFVVGARILMVDVTDGQKPKYYSYVVSDPVHAVALNAFAPLGASGTYATPGGSNTVCEKLVFIVDYVGAGDSAVSGKIALVYDDDLHDFEISPRMKTVKVGEDTTQLTVTSDTDAYYTSFGGFTLDVTIKDSEPFVNTTYDDRTYTVTLSVDGEEKLPDGAYALLDGIKYYSNKGVITLPAQSAGSMSVWLYSALPLSVSELGQVKIKVGLTSAVSVATTLPAEKSETLVFKCIDVTSCAIDAEIVEKVFETGRLLQVDITLKYRGITEVFLNVRKKNGDGTYSQIFDHVSVSLPTGDDPFAVDLGNGLDLSAGETYEFTFIGCVEGTEVCRDVCYLVGGYGY